VLVQRHTAGRPWTTVARVSTDSRGYWSRHMRLSRGASYRFVPADGAAHASAVRAR
jgi:hypothetical protein